MEELKFTSLQHEVQQVIDLIGAGNFADANERLIEASDILDELLDFSEADEDLIEISRYQVLLNQLQQKINKCPKIVIAAPEKILPIVVNLCSRKKHFPKHLKCSCVPATLPMFCRTLITLSQQQQKPHEDSTIKPTF